jgi:phytanoyl-CoA hydroxylase
MTAAPDQRARYQRDGFLILKDFVAPGVCDDLRARAEQLVSEFDPAGVVSIFSTHQQNRISGDYFLESGDKIRFFSRKMRFSLMAL